MLQDLVRYAATTTGAEWDGAHVDLLPSNTWAALRRPRQEFNLDLNAFCRGGPGATDMVIEFATTRGMSTRADALDERLLVDGTHRSTLGSAQPAQIHDGAFRTVAR